METTCQGPGCRIQAIIVTSGHGNDDETWSTVMPDYEGNIGVIEVITKSDKYIFKK